MELKASPILKILLLFSILFTFCQENNEIPIELTDFKGEYLGQTPPGNTPTRFASDLLLACDTWWWVSPPKFSPDLKIMIFTRYYPGSSIHKKIFEMRRMDNDYWSFPEEVSFASSLYNDSHVAFSLDGNKLYFLSQRPGGPFFFVTREDNTWSEPEELNVPTILSIGFQFSITRDATIYFEANNGSADDIYSTRLVNGEYTTPESLININTVEFEEYAPYIDPDEEFIIFASNRPGGYGGNDLYISFREYGGSWLEPVNMGPEINSETGNTLPYISPDEKYFFFITSKIDDLGYNPYWVDATIIESYK